MLTDATLNQVFSALADPTRRALLETIARRSDVTVLELAEPFDMSLPAVSKHIKVLERAGLVRRSRDAQRRPCHFNPLPLKQATDWMESYRPFWEENLNRLDAYLNTLQNKEKGHAPR